MRMYLGNKGSLQNNYKIVRKAEEQLLNIFII